MSLFVFTFLHGTHACSMFSKDSLVSQARTILVIYDLPVVLIFTVSHDVIPVTEYGHTFLQNLKKNGHTFLQNLKKNVFPEVKTKNIHNFPSMFTILTSK